MKSTTRTVTIAELISLYYAEFLLVFEDEELASVATAAAVNDFLIRHPDLKRSDPLVAAA